MWYCIKCGRQLPKDELIRGYCIDCFLKYLNPIKQIPELKLVVCPSCGSWLHRGEWHTPSSENEMIENTIFQGLRKNLIEGAELLSVTVIDWRYTSRSSITANVEVEIRVDDKTIRFNREFYVKVIHQKCPKCIARAVGKHSHLIQIRFTSRDFTREYLQDVVSTVLSNVSREAIVDIKELDEGVDIELDDATPTRKILEILVKHYSAKVSSSFKSTRYNSSIGKWVGVTTYTARIPFFKKNDIVIYRDRIYIVSLVDKNKLYLLDPSTNAIEEVDVSTYWRGELKKPVRIEQEYYVVREISENTVILENLNSGELVRVRPSKLPHGLKQGDRVILIKASNIESFIVASIR